MQHEIITKTFIHTNFFRFNFVSDTEAKGLNTFVGTFALPALIFRTLCELNLTSVNWIFLSAILLAKATIFFSVMIITFFTASER
jgi:predicted permease